MIVGLYICFTMRYITLKTEELEALKLLYKNDDNLVRKRSYSLLLSNYKQSITDLAKVFGVSKRLLTMVRLMGSKRH